jgi:hypothetical protein
MIKDQFYYLAILLKGILPFFFSKLMIGMMIEISYNFELRLRITVHFGNVYGLNNISHNYQTRTDLIIKGMAA